MIVAALALSIAQAGGWAVTPSRVTVGDTIRISRTWSVEPGTQLRVGEFVPGSAAEVLSQPEVEVGEESVRVRFALALFEPGLLAVELPGMEMIAADGSIEVLEAELVSVTVRATLPAADTALSPRPSLGPVARDVRRIEPLLLLTAAVGIAGIMMALIRARRGSKDVLKTEPVNDYAIPLSSWVEAGEPRAVAVIAAERFRRFLCDRVPNLDPTFDIDSLEKRLGPDSDLPVREITELLNSLERAKFAPAFAADVIILVDDVDQIIAELAEQSSQ